MMHKYFKTREGVILIWQVTESKEELFQQLDGQTIDLLEYEKLKNERRQVEYLGTRIALKKLLNKEINLYHTSEGKPYLEDECYQISISHSQQWIAVIAHPNLSVGIDIECFQPKILKLYERFLNDEELKYFGDEKNIRKLTLIWSAKEVIYKIIGNEAVNFSHQIQVLPFKLKE
ncbi:MAG TPA: 4'-phosphopantetheinyl transferase superfamily protein, partial [Paludibacteraceae bacterium]|nr:4'-phosphopantetheinyl transferase superfamily protein [Paludibacteraceae bacterium]